MILMFAWNLLWQGAIIYGVTLLSLRLVPKGEAVTRYVAWFVALAALVAVPVVTTTVHVGTLLSAAFAGTRPSHVAFTFAPLAPATQTAVGWLLWPATVSLAWLSNAFAALWCAGASIALVRLSVSLARVWKVRRAATEIASEEGVPILASAELAVPIATGIIAPAIVLPWDLARTLNERDWRCTIEHELAHVRRGDVAANGLQRLLEALFFWNPWVRIVAGRLEIERESACDDWAVDRLGEPYAYALFLTNLARRIVKSSPLLTPSAAGSRNTLRARIEHLTSRRLQNATLNHFAVGGLTVIFAIFTAILQTWLPAQAQTAPEALAADAGPQIAQACKNPKAPVQAVNPVAPDLPRSQWPSRKVSAVVRVDVGADGKAHGARIAQSSGDANVDRAVVTAAEKSTYSPKIVGCVAQAGTYLFKAQFGP
jgi:TonB family protein